MKNRKKTMWVFVFQRYSKLWSIFLENLLNINILFLKSVCTYIYSLVKFWLIWARPKDGRKGTKETHQYEVVIWGAKIAENIWCRMLKTEKKCNLEGKIENSKVHYLASKAMIKVFHFLKNFSLLCICVLSSH